MYQFKKFKKKCDYCGEEIDVISRRCMYCGSLLELKPAGFKDDNNSYTNESESQSEEIQQAENEQTNNLGYEQVDEAIYVQVLENGSDDASNQEAAGEMLTHEQNKHLEEETTEYYHTDDISKGPKSETMPVVPAYKSDENSLSNGFKVFLTTISTLIPGLGQIIGIIMSIVFMNSEDGEDKRTFGVALMISSICVFAVTVILFFMLVLAAS